MLNRFVCRPCVNPATDAHTVVAFLVQSSFHSNSCEHDKNVCVKLCCSRVIAY